MLKGSIIQNIFVETTALIYIAISMVVLLVGGDAGTLKIENKHPYTSPIQQFKFDF